MKMDHRAHVIQLINDNAFTTIVEVGVDRGQLTFRVKSECPSVQKYFAVDPWCEYTGRGAGTLAQLSQADWDKRCTFVTDRLADDSRFTVLRCTSSEAAQRINEPIDLVFIDADHTYEACKADIELWLPKIRVGGILCGDDYSIYTGVRKAVDEVLPNADFVHRKRVWIHKKENAA